jgi:hypothetical protein
VGGLLAVAGRAWRRDGSARIELGLTGVGASLFLGFPYLATGSWPILLAALPAVALVAVVAWPAPWRPRQAPVMWLASDLRTRPLGGGPST